VQPGDVLAGKYRVDRVLGEGGMGVVVAATDIYLERRVAIKFLLDDFVRVPEAVERFLREARAAVKIQSEHVARVIDVGSLEGGAPYMVMEYLEGGDLAQTLTERGPLPIAEAATYLIQACEAIAEAHACGIIHRDLKPANLFLTRQADGSDKVKVLDFGISKSTIGPGSNLSLTRTTTVMGSPLYMSPEQMRSSREVDARADIWALGVILYELLAGVPPFNADSVPELSAKILLNEPDSLRERRPDVPVELEAAITKALAKDRAERFPSVSEFALALVNFAPRRARTNVERITKVLQAAGMSSSGLDLGPSISPPGAAPSVTNVGAATEANWGKTNGDQPRTTSRAVVLSVAFLGVATIAVGGWFAASALRAPGPTAPAVAPEVSSEMPVASAFADPSEVEPDTSAAPEPASSASAAPSSQAEDVAPATSTAPRAATAPAAARPVGAPKPTVAAKPAATAVAPKSTASAAPSRPRLKFGERK
jgi:serine/threonine-protein kinase